MGRVLQEPELYCYEEHHSSKYPPAVYADWYTVEMIAVPIGRIMPGDVFYLLESSETPNGRAILKVLTKNGLGWVFPSNLFERII